MRAREPQAANPLHRTHRPQEVGEILRPGAIRIDRLSEQHHFGESLVSHGARFAHHLREGAAALRATRRRHDAVGATVVTAPLHRNPRLHEVAPNRQHIRVVLFEVEIGQDGPLSVARAVQQLRQ